MLPILEIVNSKYKCHDEGVSNSILFKPTNIEQITQLVNSLICSREVGYNLNSVLLWNWIKSTISAVVQLVEGVGVILGTESFKLVTGIFLDLEKASDY